MSSATKLIGKVVRFQAGPAMLYYHPPKAGTLGMLGRYDARHVYMTDEKGVNFYLTNAAEFEEVEEGEVRKHYPMMAGSAPRGHGGFTGSDPEIFVVNKEGVVIPAWEFLPSKEDAPQRNVAPSPFWDGFQAEFTTTAGGCHAYLTDDIQKGLQRVLSAAQKKFPDAQLSAKSVVEIPGEILASAAPEHLTLGCAPSLNAYGDAGPMLGTDSSVVPFRFAGCHVHLGYGKKVLAKTAVEVVKSIDKIAGVVSVALFRGMEDERRRQFYGLAGEYRLPEHGLEYRTLSSSALSHPALTHLCFDMVRGSAALATDALKCIWEADEDAVRHVINEYDVKGALKIIKANKAVLERLMSRYYGTYGYVAMKLIMDGAVNHLNVTDMNKNWYLSGEWAGHSGSPNCCVTRLTTSGTSLAK